MAIRDKQSGLSGDHRDALQTDARTVYSPDGVSGMTTYPEVDMQGNMKEPNSAYSYIPLDPQENTLQPDYPARHSEQREPVFTEETPDADYIPVSVHVPLSDDPAFKETENEHSFSYQPPAENPEFSVSADTFSAISGQVSSSLDQHDDYLEDISQVSVDQNGSTSIPQKKVGKNFFSFLEKISKKKNKTVSPEQRAAAPKKRGWRKSYKERHRRRIWFEELLGWIFVPIILFFTYWCVVGLIGLFGKTPAELMEGLGIAFEALKNR